MTTPAFAYTIVCVDDVDLARVLTETAFGLAAASWWGRPATTASSRPAPPPLAFAQHDRRARHFGHDYVVAAPERYRRSASRSVSWSTTSRPPTARSWPEYASSKEPTTKPAWGGRLKPHRAVCPDSTLIRLCHRRRLTTRGRFIRVRPRCAGQGVDALSGRNYGTSCSNTCSNTGGGAAVRSRGPHSTDRLQLEDPHRSPQLGMTHRPTGARSRKRGEALRPRRLEQRTGCPRPRRDAPASRPIAPHPARLGRKGLHMRATRGETIQFTQPNQQVGCDRIDRADRDGGVCEPAVALNRASASVTPAPPAQDSSGGAGSTSSTRSSCHWVELSTWPVDPRSAQTSVPPTRTLRRRAPAVQRTTHVPGPRRPTRRRALSGRDVVIERSVGRGREARARRAGGVLTRSATSRRAPAGAPVGRPSVPSVPERWRLARALDGPADGSTQS